MTEEEIRIRKAHKIRINEREDDKPFQARCSCKKYFSAWQEYKGIAVQNGRLHVQQKVDAEVVK